MFIYTLGIWDILKHPILNLFLAIDMVIYGFISKLYQVFVTIAEARFFQAELFQTIANRLYIIIGVVMLFVVAYSLLKAIINPDNFTKGDYSAPKIITNIILAIVLIAIVPTVFNLAYQAQGLILKENVIGKIIIGGSTDTNDDTHLITDDKTKNQSFLKEAGNQMLVTVFRAFYAPRVQTTNPNQDPAELITADVSSYFDAGIFQTFDILAGNYNWTLAQADAYAQKSGDIGIYSEYMDNVGKGEIEYSYFLSTAAGIFVAWTLVAYCIDLGVRTVKLGFYQFIAPIPILTKIIPKQDKIFKNWIKVTLTTFAEVFIRVAVIYFVIFLISSLPNAFSNFWETATLGTPTWGVRLLARVFIILGLLAFAKQAPKLISDITGIDSKNMDLGISFKKKLSNSGALTAAAAVGGGITAGVRNFNRNWDKGNKIRAFKTGVSGLFGGAYRAGTTAKDAKNFEDVAKAATAGAKKTNEKSATKEQYKQDHGGSTIGVIKGHLEDAGTAVKNWATGSTGNMEKKVQDEEKAEKIKKQLDGLYEGPEYTAIKEALTKAMGEMQKYHDQEFEKLGGTKRYDEITKQLKKYEEMLSKLSSDRKGSKEGQDLQEAIKTLTDEKTRLEAAGRDYMRASAEVDRLKARKTEIEEKGIRDHSQAAAYVVYNFNKQMASSPELVRDLSSEMRAELAKLGEIKLQGDKIVDKSGKELDASTVVELTEAMKAVTKEVKNLHKEHSNSIAYQEALRKKEEKEKK